MGQLMLPDLSTQRAIVAEIEAEQALVCSNRELIRRMEAKVKSAIDRVWGESAQKLG
jgi:type I restriction enzyme M protein